MKCICTGSAAAHDAAWRELHALVEGLQLTYLSDAGGVEVRHASCQVLHLKGLCTILDRDELMKWLPQAAVQ